MTAELKTRTPRVISAHYDSIQDRHAERVKAERCLEGVKPPCVLSVESIKAYNERIKLNQANYLEASLIETWHMKILISFINQLQIDNPEMPIGQMIEMAAEKNPLDPMRKAIMDQRAREREEQELKALEKAGDAAKKFNKSMGELPGQLSVFGGRKHDDGSEAEAASEVVTKPIEAVEPAKEEAFDAPQRTLIHTILTPGEYDGFITMYKNGQHEEARRTINEYIVERTPKKGRNALFKAIDDDLSTLLPQVKEEAPAAAEALSPLEKKAAEKAAKKAAKA